MPEAYNLQKMLFITVEATWNNNLVAIEGCIMLENSPQLYLLPIEWLDQLDSRFLNAIACKTF